MYKVISHGWCVDVSSGSDDGNPSAYMSLPDVTSSEYEDTDSGSDNGGVHGPNNPGDVRLARLDHWFLAELTVVFIVLRDYLDQFPPILIRELIALWPRIRTGGLLVGSATSFISANVVADDDVPSFRTGLNSLGGLFFLAMIISADCSRRGHAEVGPNPIDAEVNENVT